MWKSILTHDYWISISWKTTVAIKEPYINYQFLPEQLPFFHQPVGVYVENLSEYVVRSPSEVLSLLTVGKKRLIFAETKMNRNSSRFEANSGFAFHPPSNYRKPLLISFRVTLIQGGTYFSFYCACSRCALTSLLDLHLKIESSLREIKIRAAMPSL